MKPLPVLVAIVLLALGFFVGRQTTPPSTDAESSHSPASSRREEKIIRVKQPDSHGGITASPTDLDSLLKLVEPSMAFATSTKLRAALGDLGPGALENLLNDLSKRGQSEPGHYVLRFSLLNHLVVKDPFRALDLLLAQDDQNFKHGSIGLVIQAAARVDMAATRAVLAQIDDQQLKTMGQNALLNAPEDATPEELLALLHEHPNQSHGGHFYHGYSPWGHPSSSNGALIKLAQKDLGAAENYARGLTNSNERKNALSRIATALAQKDPQRALEWAKAIDPTEGRDQHLTAAISAIAIKDPQMAAGLLDDIDNFQLKNNTFSTIAHHWSQKDPQGAVAWLDSLPTSQAKMQAYQSAANQIAATNPLAAIELVEKISGGSRQWLVQNTISQWAASDFDAAKNWITTQDDPFMLDAGLSSFIYTWAQRDPAEAATFLSKAPTGPNRQNQLTTLAGQWAASDRDAALNWAQTIENKEQRAQATSGVYQQWANQDPKGAARQLASLGDSEERNQLLGTLAGTWVNQDPEAARQWMDSLPVKDRTTAASSALSHLSNNQPEEAARLYDELTSSAGDHKEELSRLNNHASQIASGWSRHDPAAAAGWAENIPGEDQRGSAYRYIASEWARYDPVALSQWVDGLPVGKPRDHATEALVQNVQRVDPASAFDWADTIDDQSTRFNSLRGALDQWKKADPEAARAAVGQANVTPEQRTQLLERLK